jgi:DNA-binding MarR family transcriptional regulator
MGRRAKYPNSKDLTGNEKVLYGLIRRVTGPENSGVKPIELAKMTALSPRIIRHTLKKLEDRELILKKPDLLDLRSYFYYPNELDQSA